VVYRDLGEKVRRGIGDLAQLRVVVVDEEDGNIDIGGRVDELSAELTTDT
jgi:hypothetical protein